MLQKDFAVNHWDIFAYTHYAGRTWASELLKWQATQLLVQ